jgi:hypothetical protein
MDGIWSGPSDDDTAEYRDTATSVAEGLASTARKARIGAITAQ